MYYMHMACAMINGTRATQRWNHKVDFEGGKKENPTNQLFFFL